MAEISTAEPGPGSGGGHPHRESNNGPFESEPSAEIGTDQAAPSAGEVDSRGPDGRGPENLESSPIAAPRRFDVPDELFEAFATGQIVIIAGGGVSTESPLIGPMTLAEQLATELEIEPGKLSSPEVMTAYTRRFGRAALLQSIRERLDYVRAFPELDHEATQFHRELSTIYPVDSIVTTNWDTSFEEICGALPMVIPEDYEFWDAPGRRVFKLHGSSMNWGTVVATQADYQRCYRRLREGAMGRALRHFLAGKRLVYFGYSHSDADFSRIYGFIKRQVRDTPRVSYIVTLDESITPTTHPGCKVIYAGGQQFLARIKEQFVSERFMLDDGRYEAATLQLRELSRERERLVGIDMRDRPEVIYTHSYQDGVLHALGRVTARFYTGEYSDPTRVERLINAYVPIREEKARAGAYWDVAYINGYTSALGWLIADEDQRASLPLYFVFGALEDIYTFEQYQTAALRADRLHEPAYGVARRLAARYQDGTAALHHTPWIS
jgi:SIR2-like domain